MFSHTQDLQFEAKRDAPDPVFAKRLQEILGSKWGEMTAANQYLYQGWNRKLPGKYKEMLLGIGTEKMAHVEMISVMIARLLEGTPISMQEAAQSENPLLPSVYADSNPQHITVAGGGGSPQDSIGNPWTGAFIVASGNLMPDFHLNAAPETQGRLQVARLFPTTDDAGVREMLRFLLTRDHAHQNQWLRPIQQLPDDGSEGFPVPAAFLLSQQVNEGGSVYPNYSDGPQAGDGNWGDR
jgi:Mn-containing catalase